MTTQVSGAAVARTGDCEVDRERLIGEGATTGYLDVVSWGDVATARPV